MATQDEIEDKILQELKRRHNKVVNRNSVRALAGALGPQVEGLWQVFGGRGEALDDEKAKLTQEAILGLVCKIHDVLVEAQPALARAGFTVVAGTITAHGVDSDEVTGLAIRSRNVEITPGTTVSATGRNVRSVIGVAVGQKGENE